MIGHAAAVLASGCLAALAALHVYWGVGGVWPARDERGLVALVVGVTPTGRMPGLGACIVVTALLGFTAIVPLVARGLISAPWPDALTTLALWGAAFVLLARGLLGYLDRRLRPGIVGLPYDRWNRALYSPLCVALAGCLAASATLP